MWATSPGHGQGSSFSFTLPLAEERGPDRLAERRA
jgi:signal transduction histidine kinase